MNVCLYYALWYHRQTLKMAEWWRTWTVLLRPISDAWTLIRLRWCCSTWATASQVCVAWALKAQTMKTAQRDKCSAGRAKQALGLSIEWLWEAKCYVRILILPRLTRISIECHVTFLHYASPSPVPEVDWSRPLWGEAFMKAGTPISPLQSTDNTSNSPLGDSFVDRAPSISTQLLQK